MIVQSKKGPVHQAASAIDEIIGVMFDDLYSIDQSPRVARLEGIARGAVYQQEQLREALEAQDLERAEIALNRILKRVTRF